MTCEKIMTLSGRELDEAVHRHVFGNDRSRRSNAPPPYATDIAAAWTVHEHMVNTQLGEYAYAFQRLTGLWALYGRVPQVLRAITPELICQAALLAATKEADAS